MEIMDTGKMLLLHVVGCTLLISLHNEVCHIQLDVLTVIMMKRLSITYISLVFSHINSGSACCRGLACMFSHSSLKKHPLISGLVHDAVVSQALQGLSFPHNFMSMVALQTL